MNALQTFITLFSKSFSEASMLAKLAIIFNVGLTYFVLKLYDNTLEVNAKVNDCQEARVKDLTALFDKLRWNEAQIKTNQEEIQETSKEVDKIKAQKLSYNERD